MTPADIHKRADGIQAGDWEWSRTNFGRQLDIELLRALADVQEATKQIIAHCDTSPEGETAFERAVITARAALARVEALKP